jgi:hypothetical protein
MPCHADGKRRQRQGDVEEMQAERGGARSRFYDTEVLLRTRHRCLGLEADDHNAYQRLVDARRETPFWNRYFEIVDLLVCTENGYARPYGVDPVATITT